MSPIEIENLYNGRKTFLIEPGSWTPINLDGTNLKISLDLSLGREHGKIEPYEPSKDKKPVRAEGGGELKLPFKMRPGNTVTLQGENGRRAYKVRHLAQLPDGVKKTSDTPRSYEPPNIMGRYRKK